MILSNYFFDTNILSENSKNKLHKLKIDFNENYVVNSNLKKLLDKMITSSVVELNVSAAASPGAPYFKKLFIDFDKSFNNVIDSKFISDVIKMDLAYSINLKIFDDVIKINFLLNSLEDSIGYIAPILHSLHTFCHAFTYSYHGLVINICLDNNYRDVEWNMDMPEVFDYLHKKSKAFNVSGVTQKLDRIINLTKKEEIIKLLYHEMIHFIGLDHELVGINMNFGWRTVSLNVSEAYTEFMAIILYSAYISIHLSSIFKLNIIDTYQKMLLTETKYSIYLTSNILKFYGYDENTINDFFNSMRSKNDLVANNKNYSPIFIWEYVILRTQLLLNVDHISDLFFRPILEPWRIDSATKNKILDLMRITDQTIEMIKFNMVHYEPIKNVSYAAIDLNWNLV